MELLVLCLFPIGVVVWMSVTTPRFRQVLFGYVVLFMVLGFVYTLISGQGNPDIPHYQY